MPRFFFHVADGQDRPDAEGTLLKGVEEARAEGVALAGGILSALRLERQPFEGLQVSVVDEAGAQVLCLRVTVEDGSGSVGPILTGATA